MTRALTSCWIAQTLSSVRNLGLGEDALQAVIDLGGNEADGGLREDVAGGVEDIDGQTGADLGGALGGNVDVGFEIGVLVDGGEQGRGRDVVAEMHGNVADDAGEGRADVVVGELLLSG